MNRGFSTWFCAFFGHRWHRSANNLIHTRYGTLFICSRCKERKWKK